MPQESTVWFEITQTDQSTLQSLVINYFVHGLYATIFGFLFFGFGIMADLGSGIVMKLFQRMDVEETGNDDKLKPLLLQVRSIIPVLSECGNLWPNKGFFLRVSDSTHAIYVSLPQEENETVLSNKLQLGQFVYVEKLEHAYPVPRIKGLRPIPGRRACVGDPIDLISKERIERLSGLRDDHRKSREQSVDNVKRTRLGSRSMIGMSYMDVIERKYEGRYTKCVRQNVPEIGLSRNSSFLVDEENDDAESVMSTSSRRKSWIGLPLPISSRMEHSIDNVKRPRVRSHSMLGVSEMDFMEKKCGGGYEKCIQGNVSETRLLRNTPFLVDKENDDSVSVVSTSSYARRKGWIGLPLPSSSRRESLNPVKRRESLNPFKTGLSLPSSNRRESLNPLKRKESLNPFKRRESIDLISIKREIKPVAQNRPGCVALAPSYSYDGYDDSSSCITRRKEIDLTPPHVKNSSSIKNDKICVSRRNYDGSSERPTLKKSMTEKEILWDCLPSALVNLGKEVQRQKDSAFLAAIESLQEASAAEKLLKCLSDYSELQLGKGNSKQPLSFDRFFNLQDKLAKSRTIVQSLTDVSPPRTTNSEPNKPDSIKDAMDRKKKATFWIEAALASDLNPASVKTFTPPAETKNGATKLKKASQVVNINDISATFHYGMAMEKEEQLVWVKGRGLKTVAELGNCLQEECRTWYFAHVEEYLEEICNESIFEESSSQVAETMYRVKRLNDGLDLMVKREGCKEKSPLEDAEILEVYGRVRNKIYEILLKHVERTAKMNLENNKAIHV